MLQVFMCLKWRSLVRLHRTKRLLNMSTTRMRLEDWHFYFLDNVLYLCALKHIICTLRLLCLAKLFIWLHDSLICPVCFEWQLFLSNMSPQITICACLQFLLTFCFVSPAETNSWVSGLWLYNLPCKQVWWCISLLAVMLIFFWYL